MSLIDRLADLMASDDSIGGEPQMATLITLISDDAVDTTPGADEVVVEALKATPKPLLQLFSHSAALAKLDEWLARASSKSEERKTLQLLEVLSKMPMSIESLQSSGVGKTVNKLRKDPSAPIKDAASQLVKDWKGVAAPPGSAPPAAAPAASSAKRPLPSDSGGAAGADKRAKLPAAAAKGSSALHDDDNSLDAALSAQAAPRKASIKPDNLKARRQVKPMSLKPISTPQVAGTVYSSMSSFKQPSPTVGGPSRFAPNAPSAVSAAASSSAAERVSSIDSVGSSTPAPKGAPVPLSSELSFDVPQATKRSSRRRVTWAAPAALVEERTYTVADKAPNGPAKDWKEQMHQELEAEKQAMLAQRVGANNSVDLSGGVGGGARGMGVLGAAPAPARPSGPPRPQPRIPWKTPALLDEKFWPSTKGDLSSERDTQRRRRSSAARVAARAAAWAAVPRWAVAAAVLPKSSRSRWRYKTPPQGRWVSCRGAHSVEAWAAVAVWAAAEVWVAAAAWAAASEDARLSAQATITFVPSRVATFWPACAKTATAARSCTRRQMAEEAEVGSRSSTASKEAAAVATASSRPAEAEAEAEASTSKAASMASRSRRSICSTRCSLTTSEQLLSGAYMRSLSLSLSFSLSLANTVYG